jgi:SAM-dependent methyltransferase
MQNIKSLTGEKNWNKSLIKDSGKRKSELCKAKDFETDWYKRWCNEMNETPRLHRKQWEFAYIMQALWERECLRPSKKGLVFAVGTEPLPSVFAKYGCIITATDIHPDKGKELGWDNGNQLCFGIESLNERKLCDDETFMKAVSYKPVNMNKIPPDLNGFDFNWSSCSFEHLGSINKGMQFLKKQLQTLKPGGWAVHTTEFNISSNDLTQDNDPNTVIFRKKDIDQVVAEITAEGHFVEELDFSLGGLPQDFNVDVFPYSDDAHIRLQINEFVVTSIGLIIQKSNVEKKGRKKFIFWGK